MIRRIEGENAWVLRKKDIGTLFKVLDVTTMFLFCYRLPLLETNPLPLAYKNIKEDDLIVICKYDTYLGFMGDTLPMDFIEKVNKRWNEFYEESTRK